MNKGMCLCGDVQFNVTGSFGEVRYCHCSQCRRVTGSAFSANAKINIDNWSIKSGNSLINEFEHRPGILRAFCSKCGSPVYSKVKSDPKHIRVRLGSFESIQDTEITGHVWVSAKASWYNIQDALPCYLEAFDG